MMDINESALDDLFNRYRLSCPDIEPTAGFMPSLWQRIESRPSFLSLFQSCARTAMAACMALALLLLVLNFAGTQPLSSPSYADALVADHSAEKTDYAESVVRQPMPREVLNDSRY